MPTHHDEATAKEPVTLVQIASTSSTRSRPELRHSKSFIEHQETSYKRSKRRLLVGGLLLVATTTGVTIVMVWLGVNGWFGDGKRKVKFP